MPGKNVTIPQEGETRGNKKQGWIQSDKDAHDVMWRVGKKHPSALPLLHFMISKLNRGAGGLVISSASIARQMGLSERTIKSAVAALKDSRFVQILKTGNSNIYIINSKVAWQSRRGLRYAAFNAQLIIDEQEQLRTVEEIEKEAGELLEVPVFQAFDNDPVAPIDVDMREVGDDNAQGNLLDDNPPQPTKRRRTRKQIAQASAE